MIRRIFFLAAIGAAFVLGACTEESPFHKVAAEEAPNNGANNGDDIDGETNNGGNNGRVDSNNMFGDQVAYCGLFPEMDLVEAGVTCLPCLEDVQCGTEFACDDGMSPATCRDMEELDPCEGRRWLDGDYTCQFRIPDAPEHFQGTPYEDSYHTVVDNDDCRLVGDVEFNVEGISLNNTQGVLVLVEPQGFDYDADIGEVLVCRRR